tara:strand:+ start:420 stop:758 length:339 start_codon:yes stop_codon:yes gene_type:complete
MKKILLIGLCLLFILGNKPIIETQPKERIVPLSEILMYCNTPEFIKGMATNDYMLGLAASGAINDSKHRMLLSMELFVNPRNKQWAIVFNYTKGNLSCIIGGNHIKLFSPKN